MELLDTLSYVMLIIEQLDLGTPDVWRTYAWEESAFWTLCGLLEDILPEEPKLHGAKGQLVFGMGFHRFCSIFLLEKDQYKPIYFFFMCYAWYSYHMIIIVLIIITSTMIIVIIMIVIVIIIIIISIIITMIIIVIITIIYHYYHSYHHSKAV